MKLKGPLPFVFFAVVMIASLAEALLLSRRQRYDWKAFGVSFFDQIVRHLVVLFVPFSLGGHAVTFLHEHRLTTIPLTSWQAFLVLFLGLEFCYYWYHRAAHRIRWFWANHSVHHSSNDFNFAAAFRLGMLGKIVGTVLFFLPLIWLGFSIESVLGALSVNLLYQFWIHATWIPKLGWLEYLLNTPSAHRVHHSANLAYMDANYGGVLIVFDRLFGTYVAERDDVPCRYGLVHPQTSYNPLRVELDPWVSLFRDVVHAGSVRGALGYLFMPPGWRHDGPGETTEELRAAAVSETASEKRVIHHPGDMSIQF